MFAQRLYVRCNANNNYDDAHHYWSISLVLFRLHFKKLYFRSLIIKTLQPYYCSSSSNEPQDAIRKQWKYDVIVSKATNRISWSSSCNNSCSVNNVPDIAAGLLSSHLLINSTATTETVTFFVFIYIL